MPDLAATNLALFGFSGCHHDSSYLNGICGGRLARGALTSLVVAQAEDPVWMSYYWSWRSRVVD